MRIGKSDADGMDDLLPDEPTVHDRQILRLQNELEGERDARREDRFVFIVVLVLLLDVVFFSVMDSFGGPIALLTLELIVLIPLARRMGMDEIATIFDRVLSRLTDSARNGEGD